ncbi:MAG: hypothetical protein ACKOPM_08395 [Novosphingobium sp.]
MPTRCWSRLLCGDAKSEVGFAALMGGDKADLVFTDPPCNVKIDGNVCGLGETGRYRTNAWDHAGRQLSQRPLGWTSSNDGQ